VLKAVYQHKGWPDGPAGFLLLAGLPEAERNELVGTVWEEITRTPQPEHLQRDLHP
jgi:hypothetical protein